MKILINAYQVLSKALWMWQRPYELSRYNQWGNKLDVKGSYIIFICVLRINHKIQKILLPRKLPKFLCCCHLACFILQDKFPITINAETYTVIQQSNKRNLLWLQFYRLLSRGTLLQENYMALLFVLALVVNIMVIVTW